MYKERLSGIVNKFEGQKVILAGDISKKNGGNIVSAESLELLIA